MQVQDHTPLVHDTAGQFAAANQVPQHAARHQVPHLLLKGVLRPTALGCHTQPLANEHFEHLRRPASSSMCEANPFTVQQHAGLRCRPELACAQLRSYVLHPRGGWTMSRPPGHRHHPPCSMQVLAASVPRTCECRNCCRNSRTPAFLCCATNAAWSNAKPWALQRVEQAWLFNRQL